MSTFSELAEFHLRASGGVPPKISELANLEQRCTFQDKRRENPELVGRMRNWLGLDGGTSVRFCGEETARIASALLALDAISHEEVEGLGDAFTVERKGYCLEHGIVATRKVRGEPAFVYTCSHEPTQRVSDPVPGLRAKR